MEHQKAPKSLVQTGTDVEARPALSRTGYQRARRNVFAAMAAVSLVPLVVLTVINYVQYARSLESERREKVGRFLSTNKRSIALFLSERRSALDFINSEWNFGEGCDAETLARIIHNMNEAFALGSVVDIGVIDSSGTQICYAGPYELEGRSYAEQDWFHRVSRRRVFTSEVFLGHRKLPHLVLATRHERDETDYYILRVTIDADVLGEQMVKTGLTPDDDVFLVNEQGVLQTESRRYGKRLDSIPLAVPHYSPEPTVLNYRDERGRAILLGHVHIPDSPYNLMFIGPIGRTPWGGLPARLFGFLGISSLLILLVIFWGSRQFLRQLRNENIRRAKMMHKVEYSNKLASIGRLAAGVAHEINNPLSIINEKGGLLKDIVTLEKEYPRREKILGLVDSVLGSVERCRKITHRLLGFAKHMDTGHEEIDIPTLLKEVIGFLEKEAEYRNITVSFDAHANVPSIESDRAQLQQVFLNLINNAIAAVDEGGNVDIGIGYREGKRVTVAISDDGVGIPKENLERIFEPFFTTKEGSGTGLGLSITHGIVEKLGGEIHVESEVGAGTRFSVILPLKRGV